MKPDDDDKGEEIAPGVYVRDVSDEEAAATMDMSVDELRARLENAARSVDECCATGEGHHMGAHGPNGEMQCKYCGAPKLYTLDEVLDQMEAQRPGFKARVEAIRQEHRRKLQ